MAIPTNDWYTIKSGDTLSKIAKEAGIPDWKTIYNDPQNADFRKKRPDPDKIFPGDKIWIPGNPKTSTGKKTVFVAPAEKIIVTEVYFDSQVDVHYVRLVANHTAYLAPSVPDNPGYLHLNPPKVYPEVGKPHWIFDTATSKVSESWPTVLIRNGANTANTAKRSLRVNFSSSNAFDGDRIIKAENVSGELVIGEQTVTFKKGNAEKVNFTFLKVPLTVDKMSGCSLKWFSKNSASGSFTEICQTQHTIYLVDEKPLRANLRGVDMYLFEIIDWSCEWAIGKTGLKAVIDAVWKEFYPVRSNHATGFVYWKNWNHPVTPVSARDLNQTIDFAIRSRDDKNPLTRNGASCVVFDNIFINCLLLQGIKVAEIKVVLTSASTKDFIYNGKKYQGRAFNASSVNAQGNSNAPRSWESHWIADVHDEGGTWKIYDPSYGAASYDSNDPSVNNPVKIQPYEKVGVKDFSCYDYTAKGWVDLPPGAKADEPPHIAGTVFWKLPPDKP